MDLEVPQNRITLALDQSTSSTGWAVFRGNKLIDYGIYRADGFTEERIDYMRNWFLKKIHEITLDPDVELRIVLEDIQVQRNDVKTFKTLAHLQGVLINTAFREFKELKPKKSTLNIYYSSEWKSTCGIKGKDRTAQKQNAQKFVLENFKMKVPQDACDAICIGIHDIKQNDVLNFE